MGGDGIKLFTGSIMGHGKITVMPAKMWRGRQCRSRMPTASRSSRIPPTMRVLTMRWRQGSTFWRTPSLSKTDIRRRELATMKAQHTALIPTLTLWEVELEKDHAPAADEQAVCAARRE